MSNNRRNFLKNSSSAALALVLFPHLFSCKSGTPSDAAVTKAVEKASKILFDVPAGVDYKLNNITGNVWTFVQRGGTIGVYIEDGAVCVVDTQFKLQSNNLIGQIQSKTSNKIDLLINTHHHGDHTAGNIAYKGLIKEHVAHTNAVDNQRKSAESRNIVDKQMFADTVFDKEWSSKLGSETVKLKYYGAGHTDGDIVTTFENSNVVHMGDLVFNRRFPYIDKANGANVINWVNVLDQVIADNNAETKYIFGHSDGGYDITGGQEDVRAFQKYLEQLLVLGTNCKKQGLSLEKAKETIKSVPGAEEWKGPGISRSLDAIYEELAI